MRMQVAVVAMAVVFGLGSMSAGMVLAEGKAKMPPRLLKGEVVKIIDDENYLRTEHWVVKDEQGQEYKIEVDQETRMPANLKVGDRIVAEVEPQGHAWSIREYHSSGLGAVVQFGQDRRTGPPAQSDLPGH